MSENKLNKVTRSQSVTSCCNTNSDKKRVRNRAKSWCFTLNNYTEKDVVTLSRPKWKNIVTKKICFQEEIGKNGVPHLQGVVQFGDSVSFSTLKDFHGEIHWEKCKSLAASIKYCSKSDTRNGKQYTHGILEKQLWKGSRKPMRLEGFDSKAMYKSMREQMQSYHVIWEPLYVEPYKKPRWLVAFEQDSHDSTPNPSPGEESLRSNPQLC